MRSMPEKPLMHCIQYNTIQYINTLDGNPALIWFCV